jgi:two-component system sensor histidine kinase KdpD
MGQVGLGGGRASDDQRGPLGRDLRAESRAQLPHPLGGTPAAAAGAAASAGPAAAGHDPSTPPNATEIVDILSHELRSPITTIHLGTKVLLGAGPDIPGPVRDEVVEAVEEEAERLYRLVENLLAVARHEGGANPLALRPLLLQHWLVRVIEGEVRADRGLRVRAAVPADLPPVLADDGALAQVIRNLLLNAARYAADGMPVEVVARRPDPRTLEIDVLDRGPGFSARERDLLFEPFYRTPSAAALGSGAGLGLTAARRLMRAMSGDLHADAREGGGARFVLRLAIAGDDDADEDTGAASAAA